MFVFKAIPLGVSIYKYPSLLSFLLKFLTLCFALIFLQRDIAKMDRTDTGLQEVFKSVFPIKDFSERGTLEFVNYEFEEPKYSDIVLNAEINSSNQLLKKLIKLIK